MRKIKSRVIRQSATLLVLLAFLTNFQSSPGQTPPQKPPQNPPPQPQGMGGVITGTPLNYASKRTTGITDLKAPLVFEDVTGKTALANFQHHAGTPAKDYIFEVPSGGVAIFDYDGDGLPDIYLLNGSTIPALLGKEKPPRAALYHNLETGVRRCYRQGGCSHERWGMGVAIGDYDNDGRPDIFRNFGIARLYRSTAMAPSRIWPRLSRQEGLEHWRDLGRLRRRWPADLLFPAIWKLISTIFRPARSRDKPGSVGQNFASFGARR
jgi:hypothetical protein